MTNYSNGYLAQNTGGSLVPLPSPIAGLSGQGMMQLLRDRAAVASRDATRSPDDPMIDAWWAGYNVSNAPHNYFDYYFSGQDIRVYVDGTEGFPEFADLPISDFAFNIIQQKMPIYGFWSYTYDAIARGTRIVNGSFRLVTQAPDYMRRCLEAAAEARQNRGTGSYTYFRGLTDDDKNIEKYWGSNLDPSLAALGKQIFSTHPPFSFVIVYGVQSVSVDSTNSAIKGLNKAYQLFHDDNPIYQDTNERLVDSDPIDQANRIIIDACELVNMSTEFHSNGQLVVEDYQFIGRDMVIPARSSSNKVITLSV